MSGSFVPVGEAQFLLGNAIDKSHGAQHEAIIRALAYACLEYGFSSCLKGYCLAPVSFTAIGDIVKAECPDLFQTMRLREVLNSPQCQKYFSVLEGPPRSNPHVIINNLRFLINHHHLPRVQHLLPDVHAVNLHPKNAEYDDDIYRLNMCENCLESSQYVQPEPEPAVQQPLVPAIPQPAAPFRYGQSAPAAAFAVSRLTSLIGNTPPSTNSVLYRMGIAFA